MHVTKMHLAFANASIAHTGAPLAKRVLSIIESHQAAMHRQAYESALKSAETRLAREKAIAQFATE